MTALKVMVAGSWSVTEPSTLSAASDFGAWLAARGYWTITGGGEGIARASSQGAVLAGGIAVAFHPGARVADLLSDDHHTLTVYTDSGWDGRSLAAVKSCDVVVALGGHAGTLLEITAAYLHGLTTIIHRGTSEMVTRLEPFLYEQAYLDDRRTGRVVIARTIDEVRNQVDAIAAARLQ